MNTRLKRAARPFAAALLVAMAGCGGFGAGPEPSGSASFRVDWPERSRLIPVTCDSIKVTVRNGATIVVSRVLARPAIGGSSSTAFNGLAAGDLTVEAVAYPSTDGTGTAQAQAAAPLRITGGQTTPITVTMASTITTIEITPSNPTIGAGEQVALRATARDSANRVVLTTHLTMQWTSLNTGVATVDAGGNATAAAAGTAQLRVTDSESGVAATTTLTVSAAAAEKLYVADRQNARVVALRDFSTTGWASFGPLVSGAQSLSNVSDVWTDTGGNVYVADAGSSRIARFTSSSAAVFGSPGSGSNQFFGARGIAVDGSGRIYVADTGNNRLVRIDNIQGAGWIAYTGTGPGTSLRAPSDVFIDSQNRIYVADTGNHRVVRFTDMAGAGFTELSATGVEATALCVDSAARIYVADAVNDRIVRFNDMTGAGQVSYGAQGSGTGQFNGASGVAVNAAGRIYIADEQNHRIVRMDGMNGAGWITYGTSGSNNGEFRYPSALFVR